MSLWKRLASHADCEQRMAAYYEEKGLLDLRLYLAPWIEDRIMSEQFPSNSPEHYERVALKFHEELQQKILSTRTASDPTVKFRLVELCKLLQRTSPVELYTHLRGGLHKELQFVTEQTVTTAAIANTGTSVAGGGGGGGVNTGTGVGGGGGQSMPINTYDMNNQMGTNLVPSGVYMDTGDNSITFHNGTGNVTGTVANVMASPRPELYNIDAYMQQAMEDLALTREVIHQFQNQYQFMVANNCIESGFKTLFQQAGSIIAKMRCLVDMYEGFQEQVITALKNWRRQQALAGNGAPFSENMLDHIQLCFGMLEKFVSELLLAVDDLAKVRLTTEIDIPVNQILERIECALKNLVCSAFIVDKQPPQVMKTNTRFAASVRWLVGAQLGMHQNPPIVECIITSEAQAQMFVKQRTHAEANLAGQSSGEIQNCSSTMEYQPNTRVFSAHFRSMQLKKIKRTEKKGTESVMDEKFALFFYSTTQVGKYKIRVWTLSLPVVVIVHGNQEPQSWATITWDNAFAEIVRDPFVVTAHVSWEKLSIALNTKFGSATQRMLTQENLDFLHEKLQRDNSPNDCISWNQFCKEALPDRTFTFWEWFFAIMKLTKDHLLNMWKAGRISGFINKTKAQEDLRKACTGVGTFLIRFSDSELGGVTIAYVNSYGHVSMLEPWTARDFNILSLADRIRDLDVLRCLHPTDVNVQPLDRDVAFNDFYTQRHAVPPRGDGYVPSAIRVHVRTNPETGSITNSPIPSMQSPPQDTMSIGNNYYYNPLSVGTTTSSSTHLQESDSDDSTIAEQLAQYVTNSQDPEVLQEISYTLYNTLYGQQYATSPSPSSSVTSTVLQPY